MEAHMRLVESDPEFRKNRARIHSQTDIMIARGMTEKKVPVTIPVVVHVVYKTAAENISLAQITSQIDALNRDYAAQNLDKIKTPPVWAGLIVDSKIRFALATKDPKGKTTNGITRTKTKSTSFTTDDKVKHKATGGADAWPTTKYLNLWACTLGGGLLGYAQFPGGPAATDGVVILNTAFGTTGTAAAPFNWAIGSISITFGATPPTAPVPIMFPTRRKQSCQTTARRHFRTSRAATVPTAICSSTTWTTSTTRPW
jgi:hypothetical protein